MSLANCDHFDPLNVGAFCDRLLDRNIVQNQQSWGQPIEASFESAFVRLEKALTLRSGDFRVL